MKALIKINIYGGNTLLATLNKHDNLPTGIYSERPMKSLINITPCVQANVKLQIEAVSLSTDETLLLVSDKRLQISEILKTLGVDNFVVFVKDAERHGWIVEKYIDAINQYFHLDHNNRTLSAPGILCENGLYFFLLLLMSSTPLIVLKFMSSGYLASPFWAFALFLGLTVAAYAISFGVVQYMRTRGEPIL